jgi:hypothetical protein
VPIYTVFFKALNPGSIEYGSGDEHILSRLNFSLHVDGKKAGDFVTDLKQVIGGKFEDIEVSAPQHYDGPFDYDGFSQAVRACFRNLVGPSASLLRFAEGAKNIKIVGQGTIVDEVRYTWFFDPSTGERRRVL